MKFYLDECVSYKVLEPLKRVFTDHEFLDYRSTGLTGMKDIPLFDQMRFRGVDVFLTVDRSQLGNPAELAAIRAGGCHWVGFAAPSGRGVSLIARTGAMLLETVSFISDNEPVVPTAYRPKANGRQLHQLFTDVKPIGDL
ncbi:hypothetical protein [Leifsonia virtsii]|uniref:VapC45 PIN like domain-containing protein n=1 Tax=Leifsonia virtsii TaxID=3035915 RepID=A0ABT8ISW7_9MICO|nr:hypothetical protein [Leifsonia virtsii]MDN4595894.1 hypothetical protein [Leifsonia virtsii]